jgi:integrase
MLRQDECAVRADWIDLRKFMLATGERIGETLAVTWRDLDRETGEIECGHQVQCRAVGAGAPAGEVGCWWADSSAAAWALEMLLARWKHDTSLDAPIFPDSVGGFLGSSQPSAAAAGRTPAGREPAAG